MFCILGFKRNQNHHYSFIIRFFQLKREQLIQQAAQERKQREEFRKHTLIAIKLQSQIRKYLTCKNWVNIL